MKSFTVVCELIWKESRHTLKSLFFWLLIIIFCISCYLEFNGKIKYIPLQSQSDVMNYNNKVGYTFIIKDPTDEQKRNFLKSILEDDSNKDIIRNDTYTKIINEIDMIDLNEITELAKNVVNYNTNNGEDTLGEIFSINYASKKGYIPADLKTANDILNKNIGQDDLYSRFVKDFTSVSTIILSIYIIILFSFILERDKKDNINEVIRTSSIKSHEYILGKYLGCLIPLCIIYFLISVVFFILAYNKYNLSIGFILSMVIGIKYISEYFFVTIFFVSAFVFLMSVVITDSIATAAFCVILNICLSRFLPQAFNYGIRYSFSSGLSTDIENIIIYNRVIYTLAAVLLIIISSLMWNRVKYIGSGGLISGIRRVIKSKFKNMPV